MSAHFQPEERSNFRNNGSHPVRRFRTDVAFTIHLYGLPTHGKRPPRKVTTRRDFNHRRPALFPIFDGVTQEVLKDLRQMTLMHPDGWHFGYRDFRVAL